MNICECFKSYDLQCIHIKSCPSDYGLSWIPVTNSDISEEAWLDINEAINELLDDESFTDGPYDFMAGALTVLDDKVYLIGNQTRDIQFSKLFNTPVLT